MPKPIDELVMEYFKRHPKEELKHGPVVDWVTEQYRKSHPTNPRDPWRAIRKLHQDGTLIKVRKGVYMYDPIRITEVETWDFSPETKTAILKRDGYRCVVCGRGTREGVELTVDHIKPKDMGGTNEASNGETLCTQHNLIKKNYSQTEAGKRFFIKLYESAVAMNDAKMIRFCKGIFDMYDRFGIDEQIQRPDK